MKSSLERKPKEAHHAFDLAQYGNTNRLAKVEYQTLKKQRVNSIQKNNYTCDRFIPRRQGVDFDQSLSKLMQKKTPENKGYEEYGYSSKFKKALAITMLGTEDYSTNRILQFSNKQQENVRKDALQDMSMFLKFKARTSNMYSASRNIPSSPTRILDAPDLRDDYYLNLLTWSKSNILAVALGQVVYLWNADTGSIEELHPCASTNDYVTSVAWIEDGTSQLAIGTDHAEIQLWDASESKKIRTLTGHEGRVGSLAWNWSTLTSGSRDAMIIHHDIRNSRHITSTLSGHHQEVCGLAWSPSGNMLASGGNDNYLCIWDAHGMSNRNGTFATNNLAPKYTLTQHQAAVKALAWCPWERNVLASGGGTADRTIKFWNVSSGSLVNSIDTGSQVCGLVWNRTEKEILSSHGFSQNELCLWKYPTMSKIKELTGHTARVLHMAMNPDGSSVVSAAADETLRFWNVFEPTSSQKKSFHRRNELTTIMGIR